MYEELRAPAPEWPFVGVERQEHARAVALRERASLGEREIAV
jgi:hypothetical protein